MQHTQQIHAGDPAYASPVIRPPSPASSVGTAYGPDETSLSDSGLTQDAFERKWIAHLRLDEPKHEEVHNLNEVLIIPPSDPREQKLLFEAILRGFRQRVQQLEEDEIFQQTVINGSQIGMEQLPSADNVDTLIQNMMGTSIGNGASHVQDGPWNRRNTAHVVSSSMRTTGKEQQILGQY
ncbi:uncharacterized protein EDB91DRAFT_1247730 [Suillus paluster]|uniref:uncharacterized protein n=1 Tax=Suillus paluster TaxID=48578 RepID=UPI001B86C87B|nr:uncharacterized protein EDB91DRAFT_1247730 [Suillus paluster]KAG1742339.1 hypothetical protein EDB91DRAFT_1247730 [Suillus paluster]